MIKRIIPRLEFKGPNLIKGLEFEGNRSLGNLKFFSDFYLSSDKTYADEIFFYDIVASLYDQKFNFDIISSLNLYSKVPVTFCGGIRDLSDINQALELGADKISVNTSLFKNKDFLREAVNHYGSPTIISNVEYYFDGNKFLVLTEFGRTIVNEDLYDWINFLQENGVGEINLFDVKKDGLGEGAKIDQINEISKNIKVPFIIGCGYGDKKHVCEVLKETDCSGVSIASLFHYSLEQKFEKPFASYDGPYLRKGSNIDSGNIEFLTNGYGGFKEFFVNPCSIKSLKEYLFNQNIKVRL